MPAPGPTASPSPTSRSPGVQESQKLSRYPQIGRPVEDMLPGFREWVVEFGQGACIALYHFDGEQIVILTVLHGREAGY